MTGKVIQGFFVGGRARVPATVVQPKAMPRPLGPPVPAFAGRPPVAQARGPGEPLQIDPRQVGLTSGGGGRPLPDAVRGKMEAALGANFSAVRVHVGPQADRIGAVAFTMGSDIYFAPGRFQPDTMQGQELLGHELAHVVQQRQGRVRNPLGSGVAVVQDHALETEADRLGMRAARYVQAKIASAGPAWRSTRQDLTAGLISGALRVAPGVAAAVQRRAIASFLVIQRKTALTFNPAHDKAGSVKIASVAHQRELHNSTQRTLAAYLSGYGTPPGGTCNHHVPYTLIRSEIERKLTSAADLEAAVLWMHALNLPGAENYDWNQWGWQLAANSQFSVGAMPSPHITPTKTVLGTAYYAEAALNETVNDLIWNLANDPRNLFYWPNSTGDGGGTTVDNPTGAGSMPIKHITGRLQSYRTKLQNLGLNV